MRRSRALSSWSATTSSRHHVDEVSLLVHSKQEPLLGRVSLDDPPLRLPRDPVTVEREVREGAHVLLGVEEHRLRPGEREDVVATEELIRPLVVGPEHEEPLDGPPALALLLELRVHA